ncbi:hypothetical protein FE257_008741 [Aspergillus nanangensis]|uniref:amidase n=1 Tax=Aspergillus nanangensis TaxID=2582783 RepID=A0AAD4CKQ1_ASPNN|nr:hypothetical protein FE257_008741 [Aspergillus nanangensis]
MTIEMNNPPRTWEEIVEKKRLEAFNKIPEAWRLPAHYTDRVNEDACWNVLNVPRECCILTDRELQITEEYDAVALVEAISGACFTAEEVAVAFCKRAAIAQQLTRCLTETFFDEAIEHARGLDQFFREHGKVKGPLHGLPISMKDSFCVKGHEATVGFVSFIGKSTATTNSPLVDILLESGAVLYVKTNIPQTMMTADSENNIFGRVLNPHKLCLGAGGSSGGEGALVAMRGSILGVGTDIAGSVRIPALCCGVFGFKPTAGRIPYGGQSSGNRKGNPGIQPCAGPLATSFRDMAFFMDAVLSARPWDSDPTALAVPWKTATAKKSVLNIGVVGEDTTTYPFHSAVARTLSSAVEVLKQAGHRLIPLDTAPPIVAEAAALSFKLFALDNSRTPRQHIDASGEPPVRSLTDSLPDYSVRRFSLEDLFDFNAQRAEIAARWHRVWLENDLDAIIMPGHRKTASQHDTYGHPVYTVVWNLVDWPACSVPYGKVDASVDLDSDFVDGAPCSVQVVGRRFQDEELLAVAGVIASSLHG